MATRHEPYSCCINSFFCEDPFNAIDATHCASCGARLLVGDRYRLVGFLEKSKTTVRRRVYKAIDTWNDDEKIVLKIIDYPDEKLASYLKREYEFLRGVPKPFLRVEEGAYFEWLPDPENDFYTTYVLALPWIEGQDSLDWIQENGPISESQCVDWIFQILDYLEILSNLATMHRDIKPENVIVTPDGNIKLIDFGSIRRIDEDYVSILEETAFNEDGTPRRATRIFTFGYSPPEQLIGRAVIQSDFYALGKTAVYWLTGKTPADLIEEDIENWYEVCPKVSRTFVRYIDCLTSKHAAQRPINAYAIREYLEGRYLFDLEGEQFRPSKKKNIFRFAIPGVLVAAMIYFAVTQYFLEAAQRSIQVDDYNRALNELKLARLNPFSNEAIRQQAYAHLWNNDSERALEKFEEAFDRDPNDTGTLYHLGILYEKLGKESKAIEFYMKALEAEPVQIESQMRLARIALRNQDYGKAQSFLQQALDNVEKYPEKEQPTDQYFLNFYQGWLEFGKGNRSQAFSYLEKALKSQSPRGNSQLSVTPGDIFCLMAESSPKIDLNSDLGLWHGCFMNPTRTRIGINIRSERMNEFIKDSIR